ncbi:hypothetical protein KVV02_001636 [Mortierella alpina]|uniref:Uncharacterized protein n=1 Tax=Mortierella alpina TaxID=64518 RepID=A0A9P8AC66_MORAP|nr:hypothetical protein BGZ67_000919 [Mortierella alpina]KAG9326457.1 hypothetical protein KVV02_001636 [Mortierella alpina]
MRTSSASLPLLVTLLVAVVAVSAQQQPETPLPCYQEKCTPLVDALKECQITVNTATGDINFPVATNSTAETDKCLCKQSIVDAYDPCFSCGAENQKIQERFSTAKLVDSCNVNFGQGTVKMPGSAAASSSIRASSLALAAVSIVLSMVILA